MYTVSARYQILPAAVARHLDLQIASAQRLLDLVSAMLTDAGGRAEPRAAR